MNLISGTGVFGLELDLGAGKMYWTDPIGFDIQRANLDGSNVETLIPSGIYPHDIALDPENGFMYWADRTAHAIRRAHLDGSDIQNVVGAGLDPYGITIGPAIASPAVPALSRDGLVLVVGLMLAASWLLNRRGASSLS